MKLQQFQCRECRYETEEFANLAIGEAIATSCPVCLGTMVRRVSFSFHRSMPEHFNNTVGTFVNGKRHFRDELKRQAEVQSLRTGMEHNYEPVDLRDQAACGATDEGLYETEKRKRDMGLTQSKTKIIS